MATLKEPVITWFVKKSSDTDYIENNNYYAGNYLPSNKLSFDFRIWNNRYGTEKVQDLETWGIAMTFGDYEDTSLFEYMTFIINNSEIIEPSIVSGEAILVIPNNIILSGAVNDGSTKYSDNYMLLTVTIQIPENIKIKNNDLKNLSFDIIKL